MRIAMLLTLLALFGIVYFLPAAEPARPSLAELEQQRHRLRDVTRDLASPDLEKVKAAIWKLQQTKSAFALPALWKLYETGNADRRLLALRTIGISAGDAQTAERMYRVSLAEALWNLRKAAADELVRMIGRDAATARYGTAIDHPQELNTVGRMRAVQLIGHTGGSSAAALLTKLMQHPETETVVAACEGFAILNDPKAATVLIPFVQHKNSEIAAAAIEALEDATGQRNGANFVQWEATLERINKPRPTELNAVADEIHIAPSPDKEEYEGEKDYTPHYRQPYEQAIDASCIDFCVVFDTTGSMTRLWPKIGVLVDEVIRLMSKETRGVRVGSVRYRASDPSMTLTYLIKPFALTRDLEQARSDLVNASTGGGSGGLHLGLQHAISSFYWRANARKVVLIVGDTTPTDDGVRQTLDMIREGWTQDRILFHSLFIYTKYHAGEHRPLYREMARLGGGRFYEYDRTWSNLVDLTEEPKTKKERANTELPAETFRKWIEPFKPTAPSK